MSRTVQLKGWMRGRWGRWGVYVHSPGDWNERWFFLQVLSFFLCMIHLLMFFACVHNASLSLNATEYSASWNVPGRVICKFLNRPHTRLQRQPQHSLCYAHVLKWIICCIMLYHHYHVEENLLQSYVVSNCNRFSSTSGNFWLMIWNLSQCQEAIFRQRVHGGNLILELPSGHGLLTSIDFIKPSGHFQMAIKCVVHLFESN